MSHASLIRIAFVLAVATTLSAAPQLLAQQEVVYLEDFTDDSANWANFSSSAFLNHFTTDGPDDGPYASGPRSFNGLFPGATTIMLRARHEDPFNSSNDAFKRDWLEDNITDVNLWVRHNFPAPLTYLMRIAAESNANGHVYQADGPQVPPNQWTQINFDVSRFSPTLLSSEGSTYAQAYSNVGYVTFGVFVPPWTTLNPNGSINNLTSYKFDLDKVAILSPEPTMAALVGFGLLGFLGTTRSRRRPAN
jgi:hypothetical protein